MTACNSSPAAKPTPAQKASSDLTEAIAAQRAGNLSLATADYKKVLKIQPANKYAIYDLGTVYQGSGNDSAAAAQYRAAISIDPKFTSALYNLAIIESKSTPVEAASLFREVVRLDPSDAGAHYDLGSVLQTLGEPGQALIQYRLAHKYDSALAVPKGVTSATTSTVAKKSTSHT